MVLLAVLIQAWFTQKNIILNILACSILMLSLTKNGAKHSSTNCQASQNTVLQLVFYNGATAKRLIQLAISIPPGDYPVHETATNLLKMRRVSLARFLARLAAERFIARQFLMISICSTRIFSCITKMSI